MKLEYVSCAELANLKKISHFDRLPTDPASDTHANDARIFNLLNSVICLPVAVSVREHSSIQKEGKKKSPPSPGRTAVRFTQFPSVCKKRSQLSPVYSSKNAQSTAAIVSLHQSPLPSRVYL